MFVRCRSRRAAIHGVLQKLLLFLVSPVVVRPLLSEMIQTSRGGEGRPYNFFEIFTEISRERVAMIISLVVSFMRSSGPHLFISCFYQFRKRSPRNLSIVSPCISSKFQHDNRPLAKEIHSDSTRRAGSLEAVAICLPSAILRRVFSFSHLSQIIITTMSQRASRKSGSDESSTSFSGEPALQEKDEANKRWMGSVLICTSVGVIVALVILVLCLCKEEQVSDSGASGAKSTAL